MEGKFANYNWASVYNKMSDNLRWNFILRFHSSFRFLIRLCLYLAFLLGHFSVKTKSIVK